MPEAFRSNFNAYIRGKDDKCTCKSLNTTPCNSTDVTIPIINENQELVLFLKYSDILNIETFNNFDNILGHVILDYSLLQTKNIIGIFNVCLEKTEKTGYGSIMFNLVLTYLELKYPLEINPILWLGILVDNVEFDKISYIYTSAGFELPFITLKTPFGIYPFEIVSLVKNLRNFIADELSSVISYHKTLSMRYKYVSKRTNPDFIYTFSFKFDKSFMHKARLLPYLDIKGEISGASSDPNLELFREYGGSLKIYNSEIVNSDIIYKLSFETVIAGNIDLTVGETLSVRIPDTSFTYHTHPIGGYRFLNILIAPPSGPDMFSFMLDAFNQNQTQIPTLNHMVITLEGIYITSLHSDVIKNYDKVKVYIINQLQQDYGKNQNYFNQIYDYPLKDREFIWGSTSVLGDDKNIITQSIQKYMDWFNIQNKIFLGGVEFFDNIFVSWSQLNKNKFFNVNILPVYGSCIVPYEEGAIISQLLGPQYNDFNISPIPS